MLSVLIAGYQDKKERLAPAIYLSPTLIGFGLNPMLGLIGLILTFVGIIFWKDSWNETIGLADALLFLCVLMCLTNLITLGFASLIIMGVLFELLFLKNKGHQPIVWITTKWILIILILFVASMILNRWLS